MTPQQYVISFLLGEENASLSQFVFYGNRDSVPKEAKLTIIPSNFFDDGIYGTDTTLPKTPFQMLPETDIPFLFGSPRLDHVEDNRIILYADLVASAYFMLSRYEEIIKPDCRDQYGRFRAKDSVVFQQGYGMRPLVDEWGRYLRNLLRTADMDLPQESHGFSKIFLTHDIDRPFRFSTLKDALIQIGKNVLKKGEHVKNPWKIYRTDENDIFNTFDWIVKKDRSLINRFGTNLVHVIYFIISAKSTRKWHYHSLRSHKYSGVLKMLEASGARFGLHVSHEGGMNPARIPKEVKRLPSCVGRINLLSRNHYLRWTEPEHIMQMEKAGIKEDFTLGYADCAGFRVGTCRPYRFINSKTKLLTNVIIHPMEIMESALEEAQYMGLSEEDAFEVCKKIILEVYNHKGEFVLLFHNSSFIFEKYHSSLYEKVLAFLTDILQQPLETKKLYNLS